ncbi:Yos1-like protein [Kockiozyma suomiensis]|uniref:Yos1-like protein n=1 Tax=Kockiozyma suomiensis TaxID=1337062 RepID=UPI00334332F0
MFGLGRLFYVILLLVNSIAVLSEDRFLARIGWSSAQIDNSGFGAPSDAVSVKTRLINLMSAVRTLMRIPLIGINTVIILYEVVLG